MWFDAGDACTVRCLPGPKIPVSVAEFLELTRILFLRNPAECLDSSGALIAPAGKLTQWVIGEPAPMLFHFSAKLLAVAVETILIHVGLPLLIYA